MTAAADGQDAPQPARLLPLSAIKIPLLVVGL